MKRVPGATIRSTESLSLEVGSAPDPGRVRPKNEDYVRCEVPADPLLHSSCGSLFIVADGVGGAGGGAVASAEAAHTVAQEYYLNPRGDPGRTLRRAIEHANLHVYHLREGHPSLSGMQTTLTVLVVCGGRYWLGHVGASKAFLLRGDGLRPLTRDHTIVQEMRRLGLLDVPGADRHPHRHLLTRTIGGDTLVPVDLKSGSAHAGDCFVLATNSLFEHLTPENVRATFTNSPLDTAVLGRGGPP